MVGVGLGAVVAAVVGVVGRGVVGTAVSVARGGVGVVVTVVVVVVIETAVVDANVGNSKIAVAVAVAVGLGVAVEMITTAVGVGAEAMTAVFASGAFQTSHPPQTAKTTNTLALTKLSRRTACGERKGMIKC